MSATSSPPAFADPLAQKGPLPPADLFDELISAELMPCASEEASRPTIRIEAARSRFSPPAGRWAGVLVAIAVPLAGIILAAARRPSGRHRARPQAPHVTVTRRAAAARSRPARGQAHTRAARRRALRPGRARPALHRSIRHTPALVVRVSAPRESVPQTAAVSPAAPSAPQATPPPRRASPRPFSYLGR
jgi:hypothetical protein